MPWGGAQDVLFVDLVLVPLTCTLPEEGGIHSVPVSQIKEALFHSLFFLQAIRTFNYEALSIYKAWYSSAFVFGTQLVFRRGFHLVATQCKSSNY